MVLWWSVEENLRSQHKRRTKSSCFFLIKGRFAFCASCRSMGVSIRVFAPIFHLLFLVTRRLQGPTMETRVFWFSFGCGIHDRSVLWNQLRRRHVRLQSIHLWIWLDKDMGQVETLHHQANGTELLGHEELLWRSSLEHALSILAFFAIGWNWIARLQIQIWVQWHLASLFCAVEVNQVVQLQQVSGVEVTMHFAFLQHEMWVFEGLEAINILNSLHLVVGFDFCFCSAFFPWPFPLPLAMAFAVWVSGCSANCWSKLCKPSRSCFSFLLLAVVAAPTPPPRNSAQGGFLLWLLFCWGFCFGMRHLLLKLLSRYLSRQADWIFALQRKCLRTQCFFALLASFSTNASATHDGASLFSFAMP